MNSFAGKVMVDGKAYERGEEPDMGSIVCTAVRDAPFGGGQIREYSGNESDADKLPHYEDLCDGSSFLASDTKAFYLYNKSSDAWSK